jgi:glycerol-3-phosphate dehydrogenase
MRLVYNGVRVLGAIKNVFSFHSVVVSTLDFESNNTSSNLVGSTHFFNLHLQIN